MKYSVILPTYNESENLPLMISMLNKAFVDRLRSFLFLTMLWNFSLSLISTWINSNLEYEIIIVEDNSPDGTLQVAQKIATLYGEDKILILSRPGKLGLGSAYKDGLQKCSGDFVFLMDADMSHHPKHIPQFIRWWLFALNLVYFINYSHYSLYVYFKQTKGK